jgi:uncharacterized membrane protein YadS
MIQVPNNIDNGARRTAVGVEVADRKPVILTLGVEVEKLKTRSTITRKLIAMPIFLAIFIGVLLPNRLLRRRATL